MNGFRIEQTKAEAEKVFGGELNLKPDINEFIYYADVVKDGASIKLGFVKYDIEEKGSVFQIYSIYTKSNKIKTISGVGIGDTLNDLLEAYKENYNISIYFMYDEKTEKFNKQERVFILTGSEESTQIYFHMKNNKIYAIEIGMDEGC